MSVRVQSTAAATPTDLVPDPDQPKTYARTFSTMYPEFLPPIEYDRRNLVLEKLQRRDMLRRRMHIDIPEFYVGSILAVTSADEFAPTRQHRFMGMCIHRSGVGLRHRFILRNTVDGHGIEYTYDLYSAMIQRIELIRLRRAADADLHFLRDAPAEYSTWPMNMEAEVHPAHEPVPQLQLYNVPVEPPPWTSRWELQNYSALDAQSVWTHLTPWYKEKYARRLRVTPSMKYDLVLHYRGETSTERQSQIYEDMQQFESQEPVKQKMSETRRKELFPKVIRDN